MKCSVVALPRSDIFRASLDYNLITIPVFPWQIIPRLDSLLYINDTWFAQGCREVNEELSSSAEAESPERFEVVQSSISRMTENRHSSGAVRSEDRIRVYICGGSPDGTGKPLHELIYDKWCIASMATAMRATNKSAGLAPISLYDYTPTTATLNLERANALMGRVKQRAEESGAERRAVFTLYG